MKHRLVAPRGLAPCMVALSDHTTVYVPPEGVIEIEDRPVTPGFIVWGPDDNPPVASNPNHVRELIALGFQHAPQCGPVDERPVGRYVGEQWYCTTSRRPVFWDGTSWRTATGEIA